MFLPTPTPVARAVFCLLAGMAITTPALAQDVVTMRGIVVTGTKQGTSLFETPASVSVVDGAQMESSDLRTLRDIALRQPNLGSTDFSNNTPSITIRGLGFSDDESDSMSTSVLIDGVPVYGLALGHLYDLEQVEILRGPQSTLYGQNSMGGLVVLRSRDPGFTRGATVEADYGTGNRGRLSVATDLPLGERTGLRLVLGREEADGYTKNTTLDRDDTAGWDTNFARLKFLHIDDQGGEWRLGVHRMDTRGGNDLFAPEALARDHKSAATSAGRNEVAYTLLSGEYNGRVGNGDKLAVTLGASEADWLYQIPPSTFGGPTGFDMSNRHLSAEARLSGERGRFDWLVGAYASKIDRDAPYTFDLRPSYLSDTQATINGSTLAAFGEAGWRLSPAWRVAGAMRIEHDRRSMDWTGTQAGVGFSNTSTLQDVKRDDTVALPRLTLQYKPDDNQFGWLTIARGYKASGFNAYATDTLGAGSPYKPEYGNHIELGYRLQDAAGVWDVTGTVFRTELRDQQVVVLRPNGSTSTANAASSHSQGLELSGSIRPVKQLEVSGYVGLVQAQYDNYTNGGIDYAGRQFANTPRQTAGIALTWRPDSRWEAGISAARVGSSNLFPDSAVINDSYTLVDAHVSMRVDRWTFGIYGKNLGDELYYTRAMNGGLLVAGMPRTIGVRAVAEF